METDPRVRYTRALIQDAFLGLLQERPVQKITVSEICKAAQINRTTFYRHYQDCYDLLDKLKETALEKFQATLETIPKSGAQPALTAILRGLKDAAREMPALLQGGDPQFVREITGRAFAFMDLAQETRARTEESAGQREMRYTFLVGGATSATELWLKQGCQEPEEQVAAEILALCEAAMERK